MTTYNSISTTLTAALLCFPESSPLWFLSVRICGFVLEVLHINAERLMLFLKGCEFGYKNGLAF